MSPPPLQSDTRAQDARCVRRIGIPIMALVHGMNSSTAPSSKRLSGLYQRVLAGAGDLLLLSVTPVLVISYVTCISVLRYGTRTHS